MRHEGMKMNIDKMRPNLIRVMLVDDEFYIGDIVNILLKKRRDINLVGICTSGQKALAMCQKLRPHILLLDIMMPGMDGFEVASLVRKRFPEIKILVLSNIHDHESVQAMMQKEVDGYINKSVLVKDLVAAIRTTHGGEIVLSREAFRHLSGDADENKAKDFGLTEREREVLKFTGEGLTVGETACRLGIVDPTVRYHVSNITKKLGAKSYKEALIIAVKNRLL